MKPSGNNDICYLKHYVSALLWGMAMLVLVFGLLGSSCPGPRVERPLLEQLAGNRLVLASKGANDQIDIRMSIDGQVWTEPAAVSLNGTQAQTVSTPSIFHDGTFYHLYWMDASGNVRYAASRNGNQWLGQADPLTRLPPITSPSFARGASKTLAVFSSSGGVVTLEPSSSLQRSMVTQPSTVGPVSITHGNGKFVVAVVNSRGNAEIFQSNDDGASWTSVSTLPTPNLYWVQLNHADGQFLLAAKEAALRCKLFISPDAISWTEASELYCSGNTTGMLATRFQSETLFFENSGNQLLRSSKISGSMSDTHVRSVNGQFTITTGQGPQIASLRFDQATVINGTGQDLTIITLGFRARIGMANTAHVTIAGGLDEFATNVNAGQTVSIPFHVSPFAWLIQPAERLLEDNGNLDIVGATIVGLERGNCPEGPIRDRINEVRVALEQELEAKIAQGRLSELRDIATRQRILDEIQTAVKQRLSGTPGDPVLSLFDRLVTEAGCAFNEDEQFVERVIVLLGSVAVPDDPPSSVFNFNSWNQAARLNITLSSKDSTQQWRVEGTRLLLGL